MAIMSTPSTKSVSSNDNVTIDECQSETSSTAASITSTKSNCSTSTNDKSSNKRIIAWSTVGDEFVRTVRIHMGYGLSRPAQRAAELYTVH
jgi:hypothetical protein